MQRCVDAAKTTYVDYERRLVTAGDGWCTADGLYAGSHPERAANCRGNSFDLSVRMTGGSLDEGFTFDLACLDPLKVRVIAIEK